MAPDDGDGDMYDGDDGGCGGVCGGDGDGVVVAGGEALLGARLPGQMFCLLLLLMTMTVQISMRESSSLVQVIVGQLHGRTLSVL